VSYYTECQFAKYEDKNNDFYDWHIDSGVNVLNGMYDRKITVIALLSDPNTFSGGELFIGDDKTKVNLQYGSIVAFPSFLLHRVTPVTKGTRYSMVLWAHGPSWR
jgi:PKHD-type hydroxylase